VRGPALPYAKPDSTVRLLYLGDSVTFGHGVAADAALFPYVTERILEAQTGRPVETVNAGVPGYMPWQELRYLRDEGVRYAPDVIVVAFVLNDVAERLDSAFWGGSRDFNVPLAALDRVSERSGLVWLALTLGKKLRFGDVDFAARQEQDVRTLIERPEDGRVRAAWEETFRALDGIVRVCRARRIRVLLAVSPFAFQLDAPAATGRPQRQLRAYAARRGLPFLDLLPALSARAKTAGIPPRRYFLDYDHFSVAGHEAVGNIMAGFILQEGLAE
jgi:lysophospholipase L1-like esterase